MTELVITRRSVRRRRRTGRIWGGGWRRRAGQAMSAVESVPMETAHWSLLRLISG